MKPTHTAYFTYRYYIVLYVPYGIWTVQPKKSSTGNEEGIRHFSIFSTPLLRLLLISYNIWNLFIQLRNVWPIGRLFAVVFVDTPYFTVSQCRHLVDTGPREEPQVPLLVQPYCTYDATSKTTGLFLI